MRGRKREKMSDYKDVIIDHYKNPRNFGEMDHADISMDESNASCGDMIQIQVKTEPKNSRNQELKKGNDLVIKEMKWRGVGCAISTAAASMLSEKIVGMSKADLEKFGEAGIVEMLGGEVNVGRMKCATLAYRGLLKIFESN
ncbi:FeS assembly protein SufA [Candidatus Collierbacteria bacterium CG_4_10_14_0_8_um_filter_43_86]|uniref:FeS assembly protein SufA n=2 Tax=Candidatus Collieribacteriota TaxID=1752725 RepID=A0A2H0DWE1_9BACT|nr:MAG: FeS assembly protein SufA [Candidatus Collierbacteria bacterium CG22_combo_CG10-13_8_21_14_all_43_12]PIZ24518.1 MAG: FeS assembly protein SufA [Candidatus Collierbacteria bacterium CG_4_10_14_0_8_um_filter_43_86]PJB47532.1 MAG: FeS assembly protein SufA [Candidatus Collierbacteria bacterium CG_4_9_14_3_um_filter_43_16]